MLFDDLLPPAFAPRLAGSSRGLRHIGRDVCWCAVFSDIVSGRTFGLPFVAASVRAIGVCAIGLCSLLRFRSRGISFRLRRFGLFRIRCFADFDFYRFGGCCFPGFIRARLYRGIGSGIGGAITGGVTRRPTRSIRRFSIGTPIAAATAAASPAAAACRFFLAIALAVGSVSVHRTGAGAGICVGSHSIGSLGVGLFRSFTGVACFGFGIIGFVVVTLVIVTLGAPASAG